MKKLLHVLSAFAVVALLITGCSKGAQVQNIDNSSVVSSNKSIAKVESAIVKGGLNKGWQSKKIKDGQLELKILVRNRHLAVVDAFYDANGYKLVYKQSSDLDYDAAKNTIHPNYNKWVDALSKEINYELSKGTANYKAAAASTPTAVPNKTLSQPKASGSLNLNNQTVYIKKIAPYSASAPIAQNIKDECIINQQLVDFIVEFANAKGVKVVATNNIPKGAIELKVAIADAVSAGNAFTGHRKYSVVHGTLVKDAKAYYSFKAARLSGGGFFGGYKGSCAVLGRTVKAIGDDISLWLSNPVDNARLGDTHLIR